MNAENFPVVAERPLLRPDRRWFRPWRDPAQLPTLPPGCVYVFGVDGRYAEWPHAEHPRGTEPEFTRANAASVVNKRERRITATAWVPSAEAADDFRVHVVFRCQVAQAERVAAHGLTDLQAELDTHLRLVEQQMERHHQFDIGSISDARAAVAANLDKVYRQAPPDVPGMNITFEGAHVCPPRALREHYAELRETIRSQQTELQRVRHAEELLKTPERADAAALARQEITAKQAADRAFQVRDARIQRLVEQVQKWLDTDAGKRSPVDRRYFADALFHELTGKPVPGAIPVELVHSNGHADPPADGPLIPPPDRVDGI